MYYSVQISHHVHNQCFYSINLFYGTLIHAIKRKNKYFKIGNISRTKSDERQTEISLEFLLIFVRKSRNIGEIKNNVQHI